jgi:beta-glucosidase
MHNALETPQGWRDHPHFDRADSLEFGVATSGFQSEGGLNGAGEPATHWRPWEFSGRVERSGAGTGLWHRFDVAAQRARAMGLSRFRMGVEWARLFPQGSSLDASAVSAYVDRIETLRAHGLEPLVTLLHFTHPAWLGMDFWLSREAPTVFADYAYTAVAALNRALVRRGSAPLRRLLTLNEPNMLALASCVAGVFPHEARSVAEGSPLGLWRALRSLDAMLCAHTLAWRRLHALYAREAWGRPDVSTNVNFIDLYTLGKGLFDLLRAPALGVAVRDLTAFAREGRERFHRALFDGERDSQRARVAASLDGALAAAVRPAVFDRTLSTLYERWSDAPLDHLAVDLYDPFTAQQLRRADGLLSLLSGGLSPRALAGLDLSAVRLAEPWEWKAEPWALVRTLRTLTWPSPALPIDVDENGISQRRDVGEETLAREDGVSRVMFLRGYLSALVHARVAEDLPVRAYCHWTLVDNYELGRWAPRFGLYALDDPHAPEEPGAWSNMDAGGDDAAGTYARIVAAVKHPEVGARSAALERALTPDKE